MSDIPNSSEQYWYDKGFENAKDFWKPQRSEEIIGVLNRQVEAYEELLHDVDALGPQGTRYLTILSYLDNLIKLLEAIE